MTIRLRYVGHKSNRMLAEGIKRAGGALHAASNDFNQSLAILTAGNASIQDPTSVSQLLKTMSMRLNGASAADLEALGIDTTGMTQGKKSIVQQYKAMAGIDIMEGTNYKSTYQILDELYEKWDSLSMAERQAIAEASGGKRAGSVFASLMTNWEDARKVIEAAERGVAEHSGQKELENASRSIQFSINQLKSAGQELAYDFMDSGALKKTIDILGSLVNAIDDVVKATDGLIPVLAGAGLAFYAFNTVTGLTKNLVSGIKVLQGAFAALTASKIADTAANKANTISEDENTASKLRNSAANDTAAASQARETASDIADSAADTLESLNDIGGGLIEVGENAEGAAGSTGVLGTALTTLGPIGIGVTAAFVALAGAAYLVYQRNEQLKESAQTLGNEFAANSKELQGYQSQIEDLNKTLNSSTTSYEEAKSARSQLLGIQDALIEKYGKEAGNIQLITQAINGQISALDELNKREWQRTKAEFNQKRGLGGILDTANQAAHGVDSNVGVMQKEMYEANVEIVGTLNAEDEKYLESVAEIFNGEIGSRSFGTGARTKTAKFSGDLDEIYDKLLKIQREAENLDISDSLRQSINDQVTSTEETLNKYREFSEQYTLNEEILPNYQEQFDEMQKAYAEYQDTLVRQYDNDEAKQEAIEAAKRGLTDVIQFLSDSNASDRVKQYFRDMYPDIQNIIGSWELEFTLKAKVEDQDAAVNNAASIANKYSSLGAVERLKNSSNADERRDYTQIENAANSYGMDVPSFIRQLKEAGELSVNFTINESSLESYKEAARRAKMEISNEDLTNLDNIINQSEYSDMIGNLSNAHWDQVVSTQQKIIEGSNGAKSAQEALDEAIDIVAQDLLKEGEAAEGISDSFDFSGFAGAKDELSDFGALYKSIVEQMEKDPAEVHLDISEVEKFREKWATILGGDEAFNAFEEKLTSTLTSAQEKIDLLNQTATQFANQSFDMSGVTDETAAMIKQQLVDLGFLKSSVDSYVDSLRAEKVAEAEANAVRANGGVVTAQNIANLRAQGEQLGYTGEELAKYIIAMMQANGLKISGDDSWLAVLCKDLDIAIDKIRQYAVAANSIGNISYKLKNQSAGLNGMPSTVMAANNALRARNSGRNGLVYDKSSPVFGGGGGSKGGGGGGGGGKSDAEKETDILKELSSQLDEIQAAYSSLNEIVEAYNENGKLTIDQAQQLINTDFRYLAMLTNQNGQLQLNEQGFQNLAKAKLQEMKIQLARNAIDAVNNLKTEADAVNFLTYAYEGLAGATLDATEAQLRMAVAAAHARGAKQGEAADKILAGYEATKVAIGNVDFGKDSLGGKNDSDKDKTDKDKNSKDADKKQEETKTKWNWLDRLVNKIQRTIDQLAKRAEKYFNYVEKNALVDKQLAANRRMIATQELSVTYYQNKASKYLKKVPKKYRSLISGDFDPAGIKNLVAELGSGKTKKLQDYLEWQDLLEKSQDALAEAYDNERSLITNKLDNILDYFDTLIGYQQNIQKGIEAQMNIRTAKGLGTDINDLLNIYGEQRNMIDTSAQRERAYIDQANAANNDIIKSYKDQIDNVSNGYQDTVAYQKLKNKGKQGRAKKELNSEYRVLAEDVDAYIKASKNQNKKGSKGQEARATMERLHKKYEDYVAELRKEQAEASAATSAALADQVQQNRTATDEMRAQIWETIKSVLDSLFETYERRVKSLDVVVNKWGTVAEALSDLDDDTIKRYGLRDMFGVTAELSDVLLKQKQAINDEVAAYKNEYDLYQDMIAAAKSSTNEERMVRFRDILERQDLSGTSREKIEGFLEELVKGQDWQHTEWTTELEEGSNEVMSSILELVNTAEDIGEELLDKINESTNKLIDSLRALQEAYNAKAGLINDEWTVDSNGITDYGLAKVAALNDAANVARQIAAAHYKAYTNLVNLSDEAKNDESFDEDAYNLELNKAVKDYYESVKDIHSAYDEIYQIANQSLQNEVDSLSKLIENYKEALNAKKSYYDYDKRLKEQNKNIQNLQSEAAALQGVGDAASKARLKALQSELKDAQDELDDTVFNHQIEVETAALDKLIADMTEALKDTADTIQETFEKWSKSISEVTDAARAKDTEAVFSDLIYFLTKGIMSDEARTAEQQYQEQIAAESDNKQVSLNELLSEKSTKEGELLDAYNQHLADVEGQYQAALGNALWWYQNKLIAVDEYWHQSGDATLGVLPEDPTSEAESRRIIYDEYVAAVQSATTKRNNDNAGWEQWYTTETSKLNNKYDRQIELLTKEVNDLENLILTGQTVAPSTDIPGSVYADMAAGAYSSLASGVNLSTGTTADILKVIAGADGVPKISGDLSSIKVNMVDVTANVRTIANNTNTMVEQLNAIKNTITDPEINLKIEGEDLYSGLKRVGKVVIYH